MIDRNTEQAIWQWTLAQPAVSVKRWIARHFLGLAAILFGRTGLGQKILRVGMKPASISPPVNPLKQYYRRKR